jgi:endonuclease YncB( thermonuclease family)
VTCFLDGTTALGRPVAYCEVDGQDIGLLMVRQGHAIDCEIYSGGRYAEAEAQAKAEGRDLSQILGPAEYCAKT